MDRFKEDLSAPRDREDLESFLRGVDRDFPCFFLSRSLPELFSSAVVSGGVGGGTGAVAKILPSENLALSSDA